MPKKFHTKILEVFVTTEERLADLKRKFRARSGMREYRENCKALEAEIKRLEGFVADQSGVTIVEYGIIAALIAVVLVVALGDVGLGLQGVFEAVGDKI